MATPEQEDAIPRHDRHRGNRCQFGRSLHASELSAGEVRETSDVKCDPSLTMKQHKAIETLLTGYANVLTEPPRKTSLDEFSLNLTRTSRFIHLSVFRSSFSL
ncbi:hypothetical protein CHS0354_031308, partial [Potamilus streckersoni]